MINYPCGEIRSFLKTVDKSNITLITCTYHFKRGPLVKSLRDRPDFLSDASPSHCLPTFPSIYCFTTRSSFVLLRQDCFSLQSRALLPGFRGNLSKCFILCVIKDKIYISDEALTKRIKIQVLKYFKNRFINFE